MYIYSFIILMLNRQCCNGDVGGVSLENQQVAFIGRPGIQKPIMFLFLNVWNPICI